MLLCIWSQCPLCQERSRAFLLDGGARRHYFCKACGEFEITRAALSAINRGTEALREQILKKGRSLQGRRLVAIRLADESAFMERVEVAVAKRRA
jgi:hypothetical protein